MISQNVIFQDQLEDLISQGRVIGNKRGFPAVIISPDDTVDKFWAKRPRFGKLFKSRSYAKRFITASKKLNQGGFIAPDIISYLTIEDRPGEILRYHHLSGVSIRDLLETSPESIHIDQVARIFFDLHETGFLIRTLHFGNVLQDEDSKMKLIDCSNTKKKAGPLSLVQRAKNLAVPLQYADDVNRYQTAGLPDFIESYFKVGKFSPDEQEQIRTLVDQRLASR